MGKPKKNAEENSGKKSGKRPEKNFYAPDHVRAQIIEYMRDNRALLFNQFSPILMPNDKEDAWQCVVRFTNK